MTPERMSELRAQVLDEEDLTIFDEVARCLDAKATRAAYVMTWVAIAESIKQKLEAMAVRDSQVGRMLKPIQKAESQDQPIDKPLLDGARTLGFLSGDQHTRLDLIRRMRNLYAHPRYAAPSEEESDAALVTAVDLVLSRPAQWRQGYVTRVLESLFSDRHFLDNVPVTVQDYGASIAERVALDVIPFLVKGLLGRLEEIADEPERRIFYDRGLTFGVSVLETARPDLKSEAFDIVGDIQLHPVAGSLLFSTSDVWPSLPQQAQDMIVGHLVEPIRDEKVQAPTGVGLRRSLELQADGLLTDRQAARVFEAIATAPYGEIYASLTDARIPLELWVGRAIADLQSHNWYPQNASASALRRLPVSEFEPLDESTQEQLGKNVLQAADGQSNGAISLLDQMGVAPAWPVAVIRGVLLETLVNDNAEFRFKPSWFWRAVRLGLHHPASDHIFESVRDAISSSAPKHELSDSDYTSAESSLDSLAPQEPPEAQPVIAALKATVAAARARAEAED